MATKQKIRIRLKAFDHKILDQSALQIVRNINGVRSVRNELQK